MSQRSAAPDPPFQVQGSSRQPGTSNLELGTWNFEPGTQIMTDARVVFIHGLPKRIVDVIVSFNPKGFATTVIDGKAPEDELLRTVKDADFIMTYRARLGERTLRAAAKARLVQILSAGYYNM